MILEPTSYELRDFVLWSNVWKSKLLNPMLSEAVGTEGLEKKYGANQCRKSKVIQVYSIEANSDFENRSYTRWGEFPFSILAEISVENAHRRVVGVNPPWSRWIPFAEKMFDGSRRPKKK